MIDICIATVNGLGETTTDRAQLSPYFSLEQVNLNLQIVTGTAQLTLQLTPPAIHALAHAIARYKIAHSDIEGK